MATTGLDPQKTRYPSLWGTGSQLPIIGIAGSRGKTTTSWMLEAILARDGSHTASWTSAGVYLGDDPVEGELRAWERVTRAVRFGEVDVLLQELAAPMTLAVGLPRRSYPLAILTAICGNDDACHNTMEAKREREAFGTLRSALTSDGLIIANADDTSVVSCIEEYSAPVMYFALHAGNPILQKHLSEGGDAVWIDDDWILCRINGSTELVMRSREIVAAIDGALTFQVQNALSAIAAALRLGIPESSIRDVLQNYLPNPKIQPAVCNVVHAGETLVLIDAPEKLWSLRMVVRGMRHLAARRVIAVSGVFPKLSDQEAFEAARLVASIPGVVILHGENATEERLQSVVSGLRSSHVPPFVITMSGEREAVEKLLAKLDADDIGLVFTDDDRLVLDVLDSE